MMFMGQLFKAYADPFTLLNGYIQTSRFCEFIDAFAKQKAEDDRWEFFLHKVWDKSFTQFCDTLQPTQETQGMSDTDIETTIKQSMEILGTFHPSEEGEI